MNSDRNVYFVLDSKKYELLAESDQRRVKVLKIRKLQIKNFKSIENMELDHLEQALILVGKNSTGKTAVLDAVRAVGGDYKIEESDFREGHPAISIMVELELLEEDLRFLHSQGKVSKFRKYDVWFQDFQKKLPSYLDGILTFTFYAKWQSKVYYNDGIRKNNPWIKEVFPQVFYLDAQRNLENFQEGLLSYIESDLLKQMRENTCVFDRRRACNHCFECIPVLERKSVSELNVLEMAKLLDYKLYQWNLDEFSKKVNENYRRNGGTEEIIYSMNLDWNQLLRVKTESYAPQQNYKQPITKLAKGMRSVYLLSLLETYAEEGQQYPGVIIIEEPEIYLHPQMQTVAGEILYHLSKKNQVMFTTHSANMLSNFNTKQIRQIMLDEDGGSFALAHTSISRVLDDLGYSAADLMNVDFVFIVEGKQDKSRLPLLLQKYYSEVYDKNGQLSRIAIIATNSCTNIKAYANLKYMNQLYLKDRFLMVRDGDGQNPEELKHQLCKYYEERKKEETIDSLPRVLPRNVLILKYYSFENYFLNPKIMEKVGVIESEKAFYHILFRKWKEYLNRLKSGQKLQEVLGHNLESEEDLKAHMEEVKMYLRGHNLYDIFYGRFKKNEEEVLGKYIELAPREEFKDILDSIDRFIYFENRKKEND